MTARLFSCASPLHLMPQLNRQSPGMACDNNRLLHLAAERSSAPSDTGGSPANQSARSWRWSTPVADQRSKTHCLVTVVPRFSILAMSRNEYCERGVR